jgi:putative acetyltransferase
MIDGSDGAEGEPDVPGAPPMVVLRTVPYGEAEHLAEAMSDEMKERYEDDEGASPADPRHFLPPVGIFLVATVDGVDVACGGLRLLTEGTGEVKRMYTVPSKRGRGIARLLLRALLQHARDVGLADVWLETGTRQPDAIGLYLSEGFRPRAPYGHFADHPETLCYALTL